MVQMKKGCSVFSVVESATSAHDMTVRAADESVQQLYREAVLEVAARAKSVLPECRARIEQAVMLLLSPEVQWLADGTVQVRPQEPGGEAPSLRESCTCPESTRVPRGWCAHRLAAAIARRTASLVQARQAAQPSAPPAEPGPEATSAEEVALERTSIPPQYVQFIHGKPFVRYAGLLAMAHEQGLQRLEATFCSVTESLATAQATAIFLDGRLFTESADATPDNVHFGIRPHFARLALTRAKARALRDALNIGMCAVEELE